MEQKKLNIIHKWFLKYTNRPAYINYKAARKNIKLTKDFEEITKNFDHSLLNHPYKELTTFKHSGNCGDIIYSLPVVWELAKKGKAAIYLQTDQRGRYNNYHPLGNVMLNERMVEMLKPLLLYQPQCKSCEVYNGNEVDYDLDDFRKYVSLQDRGNIARWYFYVYAVFPSLSNPWLIAPKDPSIKDTILIARSHRYRNPHINYSFLQKYSNVKFIGVEEEFLDMKTSIPNLEHKQVNDFLEMATLINSCKLFIGNQSFPFAIAEGLKVNRLLEVYYLSPNVIVEGRGAHDFLYQPQFEKGVEDLFKII
ncbi:MAG: hypothetical protein ABI402_09680 [Ferruginibacter sp.]